MDRKPAGVLIVYYSLSGQSRALVKLLASGLTDVGIDVAIERIQTREECSFPFNGILQTFRMMLITFLRHRLPIKTPSAQGSASRELIILAGPTWSYNPSGPILSLLDHHGKLLFSGKRVMPLISCRGYYRLHNFLLRRQLLRCGAILEETAVIGHPVKEPWSSLGVFLRSSGYRPDRMKLLKNRYPHFGHTAPQLRHLRTYGRKLGRALIDRKPLPRLGPLSPVPNTADKRSRREAGDTTPH